MQFSLKWLLIAIAFIAISLTALLNANDLWRIGFRTAVLFSVLVAIIGAAWSVGTTRAFCGGYVIVAIPFITGFFGAEWGSELITRNALSVIHSRLVSPTEETVPRQTLIGFNRHEFDGDIGDVTQHNKDGTATVMVIRPKRQHFVNVGDASCAVLFGVLGGIIATAFYRQRLALPSN